jgi:hypothetical protein
VKNTAGKKKSSISQFLMLGNWAFYFGSSLAWFFSKMLAVPHAHQANTDEWLE